MSETVENPSFAVAPGSQPLANPKWELYAHERARCSSRLFAYRNAGFQSKDDHAARGNAAKLERNHAMSARIAWLCRQEEDVTRAKRLAIEQFKWDTLNARISDYYVMIELPILDKGGRPVLDADGAPRTRLVQDIKPFTQMTDEQIAVVQSLKYTDSGRPILEFYSKQWAATELSKMHGVTQQSVADEFGDMSLKELAAFISREQAAIGLKELAKLANAGDTAGAD